MSKSNILPGYHRTKQLSSVFSIAKGGFKAGDGAMYGYGCYMTRSIKDQLLSRMVHYGQFILEMAFDTTGFISFEEKATRRIWGENLSHIEQMQRNGAWRTLDEAGIDLKPFENLVDKVNQRLGGDSYQKDESGRIRSSAYAQELTTLLHYACDQLSSSMPEIHYTVDNTETKNVIFGKDYKRYDYRTFIPGIAFNGSQDGRVIVVYDTNRIRPRKYVKAGGNVPLSDLDWVSLRFNNQRKQLQAIMEEVARKNESQTWQAMSPGQRTFLLQSLDFMSDTVVRDWLSAGCERIITPDDVKGLITLYNEKTLISDVSSGRNPLSIQNPIVRSTLERVITENVLNDAKVRIDRWYAKLMNRRTVGINDLIEGLKYIDEKMLSPGTVVYSTPFVADEVKGVLQLEREKLLRHFVTQTRTGAERLAEEYVRHCSPPRRSRSGKMRGAKSIDGMSYGDAKRFARETAEAEEAIRQLRKGRK